MKKYSLLFLFIAPFCTANTIDKTDILSRVDAILSTVEQPHKPPFEAPDIEQQTTHESLSFLELFKQANDSFCRQEFDTAIELYTRALALEQDHAQPYMNLGVCYVKKNQFDLAIPHFLCAIQLNPNYVKALYHVGNCYKQTGDIKRAQTYLTRALTHDPSCFDAHVALGHILKDEHEFEQAIEHLRTAHEMQPNNIQIMFDLANTLNTANYTEQALDMYYELNDKYPYSVSILYNIAYTLKKLNRLQDAMPYYEMVIERKPDHAEAQFSRGLALLLTGDFERGWPAYEWRWERDTQKTSKRVFAQPVWDGSPLDGKTILLHAEQGLGDTFQFIRFARFAHEMGGQVIAVVQAPLVDIISQCPYIQNVYPLGCPAPHFDVHAPLMSVPHILHMDEHTIPTYDQYLHADEQLTNEWAERLAHDTHFKIGLCWQGNPNYSTPFLRAVVAAKSIHAGTFAPLASVENVSFYSLQKTSGEDQLSTLPDGFIINTFDEDFDRLNGRFMDTAAVIKNLDLVISVDTSVCHFAAGLGTETWTLIPNPPDWRWMLDRTDTPWYPNMRLFRQPEPGDWDSVIADICTALQQKVNGANTTVKKQKNILPAHINNNLHLGELAHELITLTIMRETNNTSFNAQRYNQVDSALQAMLIKHDIDRQTVSTKVGQLTDTLLQLFDLNKKLYALLPHTTCNHEIVETTREFYTCAMRHKRLMRELDGMIKS